jgi:hypothetical protein
LASVLESAISRKAQYTLIILGTVGEPGGNGVGALVAGAELVLVVCAEAGAGLVMARAVVRARASRRFHKHIRSIPQHGVTKSKVKRRVLILC